GKTLTRQGLDPDLPKEAGAYSLGALIEEALTEWRSVLFRPKEAWVEKEDKAQRGEGRPGEALLQALTGGGFPGL
ncbi:MAG: NADPH-dependent oxidoreductase, partial [Thermus sp.]